MPAHSSDFFSNKRIHSHFTSQSRTVADLKSLGVLSKGQTKAIVNLFSNGGMHSFYRFSQALSKESSNTLKLNTYRLICDSLPGGNTAEAASRAMSTWIKQPIFRTLAQYAIYCLIKTLSMVEYIRSFGKRSWSPIKEATEFLTSIDAKQLYLYSEIDDLIPCKDIKAHCDLVKSKGIHVEEVCWNDSEHVQHLRKHPKEYTEKVYKFLGI